MRDFRDILRKAVSDGLISDEQRESLETRFSENVLDAASDGSASQNAFGLAAELENSKDGDQGVNAADTEAPRFIRGFHDILITFGLIIALIGIATLTHIIFVLVGTWVLSEILVRRQRLALPAVVLTLTFIFILAMFVFPLLSELLPFESEELVLFAGLGAFPLMLAPFYVRFRVPIALSMMIVSVVLFACASLLLLAGQLLDLRGLFSNAPFVFNGLTLTAAMVIFAVAIWFDRKDLTRQKRYSDVAFWLHLVCAPLLLYSLVALTSAQQIGNYLDGSDPSIRDALVVILCVVSMMLIGLIIDRRAFVTSGLISLTIAAGVLFDQANLSFGNAVGIALLVVGVFVLTFGVGWQALRRFILAMLPQTIVSNVPPVRKHS